MGGYKWKSSDLLYLCDDHIDGTYSNHLNSRQCVFIIECVAVGIVEMSFILHSPGIMILLLFI